MNTRRLLLALSLLACLLLSPGLQTQSAVAQVEDGTYAYSFFSVETPAIRGKAQWPTPDLSCAGGVNIPGGGLITVVGASSDRFSIWLHPPGTDSVITSMIANARMDNAPPEGWGQTGRPRPVEACALYHKNDNGTFRLKVMFTSLHSPGQYDLALLDTGIELRISEQ